MNENVLNSKEGRKRLKKKQRPDGTKKTNNKMTHFTISIVKTKCKRSTHATKRQTLTDGIKARSNYKQTYQDTHIIQRHRLKEKGKNTYHANTNQKKGVVILL